MNKRILLEDRPPRSDCSSQVWLALVVAVAAWAIGTTVFYVSKQVS